MKTDVFDEHRHCAPYRGCDNDSLPSPDCAPAAGLTLERLCALFSADERSAELDALLGSSLFYYCAGLDPTPIAAFGCKPSVYIFVDSFRYMRAEFDTGMGILQNRVTSLGYDFVGAVDPDAAGILAFATRARLFHFASGEGDILLLYLRATDADAYRNIYLDGDEDNLGRSAPCEPYLGDEAGLCSYHRRLPFDGCDGGVAGSLSHPVPECVCNYRYEGRSRLMERAEALSPFILGYAFGRRYEAISTHPYLGDYGNDRRVTLWRLTNPEP